MFRSLTRLPMIVVLCTVVLLASEVRAQIAYVDVDATGDDDGSSWTDAYVDLQDALEEASLVGSTIEEIWVAAGTYRPGAAGATSATFQLVDGVALYGGFIGDETILGDRDPGLNETILSGDIDENDVYGEVVWDDASWDGYAWNSNTIVTGSGTDATAILDGFTIMAGSGSFGAGMYNDEGHPTVRNCTFMRNVALGAGMYNKDSDPLIEDCVFTQNKVHLGQGAGIQNEGTSSPLILRCSFTENESIGGTSAGGGAGMKNGFDTVVTVIDCYFADNECDNFFATGNSSGCNGGGIYNFGDGLWVEGCIFENNFSHAGSGIYNIGDDGTILNCLFFDNTAVSYEVSPVASVGDYGAGLAVSGSDRLTTVINCTFADNEAGEGSGIYSAGTHDVSVRNSILWGNVATGEEVPLSGAQIKGDSDVEYSCVEGWYEVIPGEDSRDPDDFPGTIDDDPLFVDAAAGDYTLQSTSPCIDAGDNDAVPLDEDLDLNGDARFFDAQDVVDSGNGDAPIVDFGAYEFGAEPLPDPEFLRGDVDADGVVDVLVDVLELLNWAYGGGIEPSCLDAADVDDDGEIIGIVDGIYLLAWSFLDGPEPADPGPDSCGADGTADALNCTEYESCP